MRRRFCNALTLLALIVAGVWLLAAPAAARSADDDVPGIALPASPVSGSLTTTTYPYAVDLNDVYRVPFRLNDRLDVALTVPSSADFDLYLLAAVSRSVGTALRAPYAQVLTYSSSALSGRNESFSYVYDRSTPTTCFVDVKEWKGSGPYTFTWKKTHLPSPSVVTTMPVAVDYGTSAHITGAVTSGEWPLAKLPVEVQVMPFGGGSWTTAVVTTTTPDGRISAYVKPERETTYRIRTRWGTGPLGQTVGWGFGPAMTVTPRAYLTIRSWPKSVERGRSFTVWGEHKPLHASPVSDHVRVRAWKRMSSGSWSYYGSFRASVDEGRWQGSFSLPSTGAWMLKAAVPTDDVHRFTLSNPRYVSVTR